MRIVLASTHDLKKNIYVYKHKNRNSLVLQGIFSQHKEIT